MSRSGYMDDYDESFPNALALYRRNVDCAIQGRRGQAFLRELIEALDAMPEKTLIADALVEDGAVCALGAIGKHRGVARLDEFDPEDHVGLAEAFGVARQLICEIEYENDRGLRNRETPEQRWQRMRDWVATQIKNWSA